VIPAWSEDPLTALARSVWSAGDLPRLAPAFADGAEEFIGRLALRPGEEVLDVACGTGGAAMVAARAGARVTGVDIAGNLIARARDAARLAHSTVRFDVADAEALPHEAGRFDATITLFGAMFAYRPERAAAELLRVTRAGGRIAMANWTPDGLLGRMHRMQEDLAPRPAAAPSPLAWGREEVVRERLGNRVTSLSCVRRTLELRFPFPPAAVTELFTSCYGPTVVTLRATGPAGRSRLRGGLTELFEAYNLATDDATRIAAEYLDVQAMIG